MLISPHQPLSKGLPHADSILSADSVTMLICGTSTQVPRTGKRGRPKLTDGKIDCAKLDYSRMEKLRIEGLGGKAYTLLAYSKALKKKVRLVIWIMPNRKHKLFFSTKLTMTGEEVLRIYRSRFQIEFCFRDAKQFVGLAHCQGRHKHQLDFSYNASFAALNAAKVMMKEKKSALFNGLI